MRSSSPSCCVASAFVGVAVVEGSDFVAVFGGGGGGDGGGGGGWDGGGGGGGGACSTDGFVSDEEDWPVVDLCVGFDVDEEVLELL